MKNTGRLAFFSLFAIVGVGLAVGVGMSASLPKEAEHPRPVPLAAVTPATGSAVVPLGPPRPAIETGAGAALPQSANKDGNAAGHPMGSFLAATDSIHRGTVSVAPEPADNASALPEAPMPPAPVLAPTSPKYGQEAVPAPSANGATTNVLEVLRKGLTGTQPPPPPIPASPTSQRSTTSVDAEGDGKLRIQIHDDDIRKVLEFLSEQANLNVLASKSVEGKVSATLTGVDIESALRAIVKSAGFACRREGNFLFVGTPDEFNNVEQGIDRIGTRVYRTNYVTAAEMKALVQPLLSEKVGVVSVSSPAEAGIATNDSTAGGDKFSGGDVVVVRDFEAVLTQVDQMVAEVDVRPLQVQIEALILSVQLKDEDKFGVNFQFLRQNPNIVFGIGSPPASLADFKLDGGLKFGFLDSNLAAFLEAVETVGDTNVVANPRLMVLNKQRAEIQIGQKQGYINQTITQTASSQSVEFLDTGTQLRLRPFVSSDGVIRMEVHPELSDGTVELKGGFTLPNKNIKQATTNVMIRDGCTVVIGGLIYEQLTNTTSQVPVLGNLPFVGFAFRQTIETTERRELLVLITPRIVYEPGTCQEGQQGACEYLRRQSTYADKMSPFGKRSIARRYYRLAATAYAEGEPKRALWFAEMAVQFDPLNREALDLRSDIWLGKPYLARGNSILVDARLANPLEGQTMPDWLIDDLQSAPASPPTPLHPLDPGIPGRHRDLVRPRALQ